MNEGIHNQFEVLNPWAEADPVPLKEIVPRLPDLNNRTIGLFSNFKCASVPMLAQIELQLKKVSSTLKFSWFRSDGVNVVEPETENKDKFTDWVKGVDAVVAAVGD